MSQPSKSLPSWSSETYSVNNKTLATPAGTFWAFWCNGQWCLNTAEPRPEEGEEDSEPAESTLGNVPSQSQIWTREVLSLEKSMIPPHSQCVIKNKTPQP